MVVEIKPLELGALKLNFHSREFVSRYRDPQLQATKNYLEFKK